MVTIVRTHLREGEKGNFISLEIQGDIELVQSMSTGRFYATAKRCFISSTFDEQTAKSLIGTSLSGKIDRVPCEPYEYEIPETKEKVQLAHTYTYVPEEKTRATVSQYATV